MKYFLLNLVIITVAAVLFYLGLWLAMSFVRLEWLTPFGSRFDRALFAFVFMVFCWKWFTVGPVIKEGDL